MNKLIGLHNHQIQFQLGNNIYLIPRKDIEEKFNLYWFMADLYRTVLRFAVKETEWFIKYKINE